MDEVRGEVVWSVWRTNGDSVRLTVINGPASAMVLLSAGDATELALAILAALPDNTRRTDD